LDEAHCQEQKFFSAKDKGSAYRVKLTGGARISLALDKLFSRLEID
jgi:hypothetical protein